MIETREQATRAQELSAEYPHGVGVAVGQLHIERGVFGIEGDYFRSVPVAFITGHDAQARPVHREIVLPDGTRFVESADG